MRRNVIKIKNYKIRSNVKELLKKEKNIIKIAQTLDIPFQTIYKWKKKDYYVNITKIFKNQTS